MSTAALVPFSPRAKVELAQLKGNKYVAYSLFFPFFLFIGLPLILAHPLILTGALLLAFTGIVVGLTLPHVKKNFEYEREQLYLNNRTDYLHAEGLREALEELMPTSPTDFRNPEPIIPGNWRPFRVEYFASSAIRGDLSRIRNRNFFEGRIEAEAYPDFLNMSTILFLIEPETNRTLRVLIPNQQATQELFAGVIKTWGKKTEYGTHMSEVVQEYAKRFSELSAAVAHCDLIDRLAASCEKPLDQRPAATVQGLELQRGVVLATKFFVDHKEALTLPSGLLGDLTIRTEKIFPPIGKLQPVRALHHPLD